MSKRDPKALTDLERAFYGDDVERVAPETPAALADAARDLVEAGRTVLPAGAGTHPFLGNQVRTPATVLSTERLASIVVYEPDDFTIALQAGVTLAELRATLAENGQEIAVDWAPQASSGTIGGLVAAGTAFAGPRDSHLGGLASQVIGVRGVRGAGRRYKAGGMVVKNVAGYDVGKLLCGSLGTAGIIAQLNFKLRPLPRSRRVGHARFASWEHASACALGLRRSPTPLATIAVIDAGRDGGLETLARGPGSASVGGSVSVVWVLEGNRGLVRDGGPVVEQSISRADLVDGIRTGGEDEAASALDQLSAIREPVDALKRSQAIAVIATLPSELPAACDEARAVFEQAGVRRRDLYADVLGGRLWLAWDAPDDEIVSVATRLREIAAGGAGWLTYVPPTLRERLPYLLHEPPRRDVIEKLLRVFDPQGLYCPGRVLHGGDEEEPER